MTYEVCCGRKRWPLELPDSLRDQPPVIELAESPSRPLRYDPTYRYEDEVVIVHRFMRCVSGYGYEPCRCGNRTSSPSDKVEPR
jgi:hypothetical protein